ncbi:Dimethylaniline monooxygenase [N-oxide-forming] 4, partial [Rhizophlyctis rosea]
MPLEIAVIGAGAAGLVAAKELLAAGFNVTVFEKGSDVGGIWAYSEDVNTPSVMRQTVMNLSSAQMVFSDFPFPEDYPPYLPHQLYHRYLQSYAKHFDVLRHIHFHTTVVSANHSDDGWTIVSTSEANNMTKEDVFDRLVVAVGQYHHPYIPDVEGQDEFKGEVVHSIQYKSFEPFKNKRVLVVGVGNSAADVAVDLAGNASEVILTGRRGM